MRTLVVLGVVAVIGVTAFLTRAWSQKPEPVTAPAATFNMGCCPMMMADSQAGPKNMTDMMDMMKQMGMEPEMTARMQLLMGAAVFVDSPAALRVQKDKLQLSPEQVDKLGAIETEARQKSLALLTPEQRAQLGDIPDEPLVMMEMCQEMMAKMGSGSGRSN